jgi:hypothetical protein
MGRLECRRAIVPQEVEPVVVRIGRVRIGLHGCVALGRGHSCSLQYS